MNITNSYEKQTFSKLENKFHKTFGMINRVIEKVFQLKKFRGAKPCINM